VSSTYKDYGIRLMKTSTQFYITHLYLYHVFADVECLMLGRAMIRAALRDSVGHVKGRVGHRRNTAKRVFGRRRTVIGFTHSRHDKFNRVRGNVGLGQAARLHVAVPSQSCDREILTSLRCPLCLHSYTK
jgi:hypothetical protein